MSFYVFCNDKTLLEHASLLLRLEKYLWKSRITDQMELFIGMSIIEFYCRSRFTRSQENWIAMAYGHVVNLNKLSYASD